ncbi:MAG: response regulator [Deltaproteobacteria bacterium]|nr:response regulator [Deltaproteobacteria bacterium]
MHDNNYPLKTEFNFTHVLLVDDSPAIINLLASFMSALGYSHAVAANSLEAVNMLQRQDFDLVIADMGMPGMNGIELLQHLRKNYPDTSSIAITGHSDKYPFVDVIKAGATDFLAKPYKKEELEAKMSRICRERTTVIAYRYEVKINKIINDLLHISLADMEFAQIFPEFMRRLTALSWLGLESRGAVFLANKDKSLELMAEYNLEKSLLVTCANVPFGTCLCGRAVQSGQVIFAGHIDARHENTYEGICDHGHYCVPMKRATGELLGVFTFYVRDGTRRLPHIENALLQVTQTAAVVIQYHLAKEKIKIDEQKFELMLESSPDGIIFVDVSGKILLANRQIERLFGYERRELLGQKVEMLIPRRFAGKHPQYRAGFIMDMHRGPMSCGSNNRWGLRRDGSEFAIETVLSQVQTEQGVYVIASIRDITERQGLQMELKAHQEHLEELVTERSQELREREAELRRQMEELEKFNRLAVGRELAMLDLKKEINRLLVKAGHEVRYNTAGS